MFFDFVSYNEDLRSIPKEKKDLRSIPKKK